MSVFFGLQVCFKAKKTYAQIHEALKVFSFVSMYVENHWEWNSLTSVRLCTAEHHVDMQPSSSFASFDALPSDHINSYESYLEGMCFTMGAALWKTSSQVWPVVLNCGNRNKGFTVGLYNSLYLVLEISSGLGVQIIYKNLKKHVI